MTDGFALIEMTAPSELATADAASSALFLREATAAERLWNQQRLLPRKARSDKLLRVC